LQGLTIVAFAHLSLIQPEQGSDMPEQRTKEESVSLEQLVISHSYEMLALITVLEKKGILARQEIIEVIRELQSRGEDG
jgi:hypothetical protein